MRQDERVCGGLRHASHAPSGRFGTTCPQKNTVNNMLQGRATEQASKLRQTVATTRRACAPAWQASAALQSSSTSTASAPWCHARATWRSEREPVPPRARAAGSVEHLHPASPRVRLCAAHDYRLHDACKLPKPRNMWQLTRTGQQNWRRTFALVTSCTNFHPFS